MLASATAPKASLILLLPVSIQLKTAISKFVDGFIKLFHVIFFHIAAKRFPRIFPTNHLINGELIVT